MQTIQESSIQEIISQHHFAQGLTAIDLSLIGQGASLQHAPIDEIIFRDGDEAEHFYVIHHGQVALETFVPGKGVVTIQTVGVGDALGWSWLFPPFRWHFTARASAPTEIITCDAEFLRRKIQDNAKFGRDLLLRLSEVLFRRLEAMRLLLLDFYGMHN